MGLKTTYQIVQEDVSMARVCAVIIGRQRSVDFPFDIKFKFTPKSASMSLSHRFTAREVTVCLDLYRPFLSLSVSPLPLLFNNSTTI